MSINEVKQPFDECNKIFSSLDNHNQKLQRSIHSPKQPKYHFCFAHSSSSSSSDSRKTRTVNMMINTAKAELTPTNPAKEISSLLPI